MTQNQKLKELALRATSGPWHIGHVSEVHDNLADIDCHLGETICELVSQHNQGYLCAVSPDKILRMIEREERLERALQEARKGLGFVRRALNCVLTTAGGSARDEADDTLKVIESILGEQ